MGEIMLQGPSKAGLYPIYLKHFSSNKSHSLVAFIGVKAPVSVWHNRLGHPSSSVFQHLLRHSQLSVSGSQRQESLCEPCLVHNDKNLFQFLVAYRIFLLSLYTLMCGPLQ